MFKVRGGTGKEGKDEKDGRKRLSRVERKFAFLGEKREETAVKEVELIAGLNSKGREGGRGI